MNIRELTSDDLRFLREMLYAAAFWRPEGEKLPIEQALEHRELKRYHEGWGRRGDAGFVAQDDGGRLVGAVWYRFFTEEDHGHGFVDEQTPELAIAVLDGWRGQGIGRELMEAMAQRARADGLPRIALSVNDDNPAKLLYTSLGYRDHEPGDGNGRMILELARPERS